MRVTSGTPAGKGGGGEARPSPPTVALPEDIVGLHAAVLVAGADHSHPERRGGHSWRPWRGRGEERRAVGAGGGEGPVARPRPLPSALLPTTTPAALAAGGELLSSGAHKMAAAGRGRGGPWRRVREAPRPLSPSPSVSPQKREPEVGRRASLPPPLLFLSGPDAAASMVSRADARDVKGRGL